jgi:addiction module HigA family antidote
MIPDLTKIKGIHPGAILKRELKCRGIKNKELASLVHEHAQTIGAIINGNRSVNPQLSIKLGLILGVDSDYFMLLQTSYDIKKAESDSFQQKTPNLTIIRPILFWDTDFNKIDWNKSKKALIRRIFERGNESEILEIVRFYGDEIIKKELINIESSFLPSFNENINRYKLHEDL